MVSAPWLSPFKKAHYVAAFFAWTTVLAFSTGCATKNSSSHIGCDSESPCSAGQICIASTCVPLCSSDADCQTTQICDLSNSSICMDCTNCRLVPEIGAINGTGSPDNTPGHASAHIVNTILVTGNHLSGGQVQLIRNTNEVVRLAAASDPSDTAIEAVLPANLTAGDYTLSVVNQAGRDSTQATLLQGERGPAGLYLAGDGIDVNGDTISVVFATNSNPSSGTSTDVARADHDHNALYPLQSEFDALLTAHSDLVTQVASNNTSLTNSITSLGNRITAIEETDLPNLTASLDTTNANLATLNSNYPANRIVHIDFANPQSYNVATCTATTVNDLSSNGTNFTLNWTPTSGDCGNGSDKYLTISNTGSHSITTASAFTIPPFAFTVEIVMALSSYNNTNRCDIYHGSTQTTHNKLHFCLRNANKRFDMDEYSSSVTTQNDGTSADYNFVDGTKYHFTLIHKSTGQYAIYINGVLQNQKYPASIGNYLANSQFLTIASFGTNNKLYMFRIWDNELLPSAILTNYCASVAAPNPKTGTICEGH